MAYYGVYNPLRADDRNDAAVAATYIADPSQPASTVVAQFALDIGRQVAAGVMGGILRGKQDIPIDNFQGLLFDSTPRFTQGNILGLADFSDDTPLLRQFANYY